MTSILTNMSSMQAQNNMRIQNEEMNQAMQRLSSGLRINTALMMPLDQRLLLKWKLR